MLKYIIEHREGQESDYDYNIPGISTEIDSWLEFSEEKLLEKISKTAYHDAESFISYFSGSYYQKEHILNAIQKKSYLYYYREYKVIPMGLSTNEDNYDLVEEQIEIESQKLKNIYTEFFLKHMEELKQKVFDECTNAEEKKKISREQEEYNNYLKLKEKFGDKVD